MSTSPNDGGPAFPLSDIEWTNARRHNNGMSLRDYFASAALQGLLASSKDIIGMSEANYATAAYLQADAMLAERNKGA
jgi:hypothetical protein